MSPSQQYRDTIRYGVRLFMTDEVEPLLDRAVSQLHMDDLEAAYELLMDWSPRRLAPPEYQPHPERRGSR